MPKTEGAWPPRDGATIAALEGGCKPSFAAAIGAIEAACQDLEFWRSRRPFLEKQPLVDFGAAADAGKRRLAEARLWQGCAAEGDGGALAAYAAAAAEGMAEEVREALEVADVAALGHLLDAEDAKRRASGEGFDAAERAAARAAARADAGVAALYGFAEDIAELRAELEAAAAAVDALRCAAALAEAALRAAEEVCGHAARVCEHAEYARHRARRRCASVWFALRPAQTDFDRGLRELALLSLECAA